MKTFSNKNLIAALVLTSAVWIYGCSGDNKSSESPAATSETAAPATSETPAPTDPMSNKGVGPVTSVTLGEIDNALGEKGKGVFETKCVACHKMDSRLVGPALSQVTKRRSPEWIMNMIMNPEGMTTTDPIAKGLLTEYGAPMANQNITEEEARAILEYFRTNDKL